MPPRATYRVQLNPDLTFDGLIGWIDYLRDLGVSHVYLSPILQATPGSQHGYDVVDHGELNRDLGGEPAYDRLCRALQEAGLSQVVDLVPNHMAIGNPSNRWWWNVLENGPASRYASFFDVDWHAAGSTDDRILIPVLGDHAGRLVEAKEIRVDLDERDRFVIRYHDHIFPTAPRSLGDLLRRSADRADSNELAFLAGAYERLPELFAADRSGTRHRHREQEVLHDILSRTLEDPTCRDAVVAEIELLNGDIERLDAFVEHQNYRLAYWRTGRQELEYRRFFDIDTLVGLRMEDEDVFEETHRRILERVEAGQITGLRIDHIDGLRDPRRYLDLLRSRAPTAWIVVEKILERGERLPENWSCAGTTGYDFLRRVTGLLLDPEGLMSLEDAARAFIGHEEDWEGTCLECKGRVLREGLRPDVARLVTLTGLVTARHRRHRDHSQDTLHMLVESFVVHWPVYRTYISARDPAPSLADRAVVDQVTRTVLERMPELDTELVSWFADVLMLRYEGDLEEELAMRFQQLTGPAMAKGMEDTAMYRHTRLLACNEVGCDPSQPAVDLDEFARAMAEAAHRRPMLTTSTHDTKRSEDVRARLAVLTEDPDTWGSRAAEWRMACEAHGGERVDAATLYALFQTLIGAWPIDRDRIGTYMEKFERERKIRTSWTRPNAQYEGDLSRLLDGIYGDADLMARLQSYVERIAPAGRLNGLAQTLIKLTAPGTPDIYQGNELWDLSLVDPDNRRPVDLDLRRRLLAELPRWPPPPEGRAKEAARIRDEDEVGRAKLWVTHVALQVRAREEEAFDGGFAPLSASGPAAERVVGYVRGDRVAVVVPRFSLKGPDFGTTTRIRLPDSAWRHAFDGQQFEGTTPVADLFEHFPVALLVKSA